MIELNRKTTIVPVQKTSQEVLMHWFNLIELNQLHRRIDNDVELTVDVFGCLMAMQPTEEITIQNTRVAKNRNLNLQNNRFKHMRSPLQIMPTSVEMYMRLAVGAISESKTTNELLLLDPTLHRNASFVCQATIVRFDLSKGWWYKSWPSCHKVVKKNFESFECNEHGFINRLPEPW
ncbi:hypothetical protein DVH24_033574 [Malus domestica]|uniref:Replication factor A C-terminal domain-containing protein n=1 Tax=Malus domestica TaxID=3750 RepID=A0A498JAE1_MALDO|nr:hypothetical protein DVH24_033574 [Malus domestica]